MPTRVRLFDIFAHGKYFCAEIIEPCFKAHIEELAVRVNAKAAEKRAVLNKDDIKILSERARKTGAEIFKERLI